MKFEITRLDEEQIQKSARRLSQLSGSDIHVSGDILTFDAQTLQQYATDLVSLKNLIQRLPDILNKKPVESLEFWNIDPALRGLIQSRLPSVATMFRPDIVFTKMGPKVVEFNVDLGALGLQTGVFARSLYRSLGNTWFFADQLLNKYWSGKNRQQVIVWDIERPTTDLYGKQLAGIFQQFSTPTKMMTASQILELSNKELENSHITRVFADARFIESARLNEQALQIFQKSPKITDDYGVENVLVDSKVALAFLWSLVLSKSLSEAEASLIQKYIPESHVLTPTSAQHVSGQKDSWVLKSAHGFQGREVFMGKDVSQEEWQCLLGTHSDSSEKPWILQKLEEPIPIELCIFNKELKMSKNVGHLFNMFFVDDQFGGALLRASVHGATKVGAINGIDCISVPVVAKY